MILNPSHNITLSGLPPDVLDAYVRYKKGTRAIVSWMVQFGPSKYHGARSLPLKELAKLATSLAGKLKELPEVVHFHFRETIAARRRLSKYFRGNGSGAAEDVDTLNHEHFTTSLADIYEDLCTRCSNPKRKCETSRTHSRGCEAGELASNQFERLSIINDRLDTADESETCAECSEEPSPTCPGFGREVALADDDLCNRVHIAIILQRMSEVVNSVQEVWQRSAAEKVHFGTAAFATNVALTDLMCLESELRDVDAEITISDIMKVCCVTAQHSSADMGFRHRSSHDLIKELQVTETALKHYTNGHRPIKIVSCSTCMQQPADFVQIAPTQGQADMSKLISALVDNMWHLIVDEKAPSNIVRNSSPAYVDLRNALFHSDRGPNSTRLTLGLHVLSESYRTYLLSSSAAVSTATCRLTVLRLAQQASKSIGQILDDKICFPCRCPQTLAYHLQVLKADLTSYTKQRCWNLYFQSPWVAGNHLLEILDLCHYYGQKLFAYRHYVGSVLHSYNVLQQLAGLEEITPLEGLCNQFEAMFFPGGRPKGSFRACWTRYIGARIKFRKGHRNRNQRDSWCMAIPAHAARKAAGLGVGEEVGDHKHDCLLFKIKQQDYSMTDAQLKDVSVQQDPRGRFEVIASIIEENLYPKDQTTIPVARINHFAVFEYCTRVISSLSNASHMDPTEQGLNCICFASAILSGADRIVNARKMGNTTGAAWTKGEREGVLELTTKAIKNEIGLIQQAADPRWTLHV